MHWEWVCPNSSTPTYVLLALWHGRKGIGDVWVALVGILGAMAIFFLRSKVEGA